MLHVAFCIMDRYVEWSRDPTPWAPTTTHGSSVNSSAASTSLSCKACQYFVSRLSSSRSSLLVAISPPVVMSSNRYPATRSRSHRSPPAWPTSSPHWVAPNRRSVTRNGQCGQPNHQRDRQGPSDWALDHRVDGRVRSDVVHRHLEEVVSRLRDVGTLREHPVTIATPV